MLAITFGIPCVVLSSCGVLNWGSADLYRSRRGVSEICEHQRIDHQGPSAHQRIVTITRDMDKLFGNWNSRELACPFVVIYLISLQSVV